MHQRWRGCGFFLTNILDKTNIGYVVLTVGFSLDEKISKKAEAWYPKWHLAIDTLLPTQRLCSRKLYLDFLLLLGDERLANTWQVCCKIGNARRVSGNCLIG